MVKQASITLKDLKVGYRGSDPPVELLKNVSDTFLPGTLTAIAGSNGVGKSTLLKTIGGLLPILHGEIQIEGKAISKLSPAEIARNVAMVLTNRVGGFNLTVFDAVAAGQMPYTNAFNKLEEVHLQAIQKAMDAAGLSAIKSRQLHELSDGQFQKTMVARAVCQGTSIMLLDEPTAFLDYKARHELFINLQELTGKDGKCILVSTHDLDLVKRYCSEVVLITSDGGYEKLPTSQVDQSATFKQISGGYI